MRAGARDYLAKPVNVGELSVVVARELEQRRLRAETGPSAGAPGREVQLRQHHRQLGADAGGVQDGRADRAVAGERPHHRRVGHGQGAHRRGDPRAQPARQGAVRQAPLRGARRVAPRERAVRPRARLVHRGADPARRAVPAGRRRDAVPRRDRRDLAGRPGQAAALPAGARVRAGRRQRDRSASTCGSSPRPTATSSGWWRRGSSARISSTA